MSQSHHVLRQLHLDDLVGSDTPPAVTHGAGPRQRLPALPDAARRADRRERGPDGGRRRHLHAHLPPEPRSRLERRHTVHQHRRAVHLARPPRHRRQPQHHRLRPHQRHRHQRSARRGGHLPRALRPLARLVRVRASRPRPRSRHQHRRRLERCDPHLGGSVAAAVLEPGPARPGSQRQLLGARAPAARGPGRHGAARGHRFRGGGVADRRGHGGVPAAVPRRRGAPHRRSDLPGWRWHVPGRALDQPERPRSLLRAHHEHPPGGGVFARSRTHRRCGAGLDHRGSPGAAVRRLESHVRRVVHRRLRSLHAEPRESDRTADRRRLDPPRPRRTLG